MKTTVHPHLFDPPSLPDDAAKLEIVLGCVNVLNQALHVHGLHVTSVDVIRLIPNEDPQAKAELPAPVVPYGTLTEE